MKEKSFAVISTCMNREAMLRVSLQSWLCNPLISEIVIVDWSSTAPIEWASSLDSRIRVIRIDGQRYFYRTKALNIGIKACSTDFVMQMDVDYILNPYYNLVEVLQKAITDKDFLVCDGWIGEGQGTGWDFLIPTNGFLCTSREALLKIGGYNEALRDWGYEDNDIQVRLASAGLNRKILRLSKTKFIYHNPHDIKMRSENYQNKNPAETWARNKAIADSSDPQALP